MDDATLTMVCTGCGRHKPAHPSGKCFACRRPAQPAPDTTPLITALIAELDKAGYTSQAQGDYVSPDTCVAIAESVAGKVRADLLRELPGLLPAAKPTMIEIRRPDQEPRQVSGQVPAWFPRLVKLAACKVPALLVGPAGCGKTTAAKMLAEALGVPFVRLSIAAGTDEGQLQGWLHPKEQMNFRYVGSPMSKTYEADDGGVVLIDDIDLGDANALGILNGALDNGGWYIALRDEQPLFVKSDKCYIMGAANTWGHGADRLYVGANQLDERTLSRFRMGQIPCDYDREMERALFADDVVSFAHDLRDRCRQVASLHRDVSTRDIESAHQLRAQFSLEEAWYGYFADWSAEQLQHVYARVDHGAMTARLT